MLLSCAYVYGYSNGLAQPSSAPIIVINIEINVTVLKSLKPKLVWSETVL